ncbi:MAG: hypothetical protein JNG88_05635 [Phycisphaerales bacterium]|nr:hypothetical protein [Phycisphaerales bacterium]
MNPVRFALALTAVLGVTCIANADDQAVLNLAGVRFQHATNQNRSSNPDQIDASDGYRYVITGSVRGESGILGILYPNATPIETILETFQPGSSEALADEVYNAGGALPIEVQNQRFEGSTVLLGITVTFGATLAAGIDANGFVYFTMTEVVMLPSSGPLRLGTMVFTSGSVTMTRIPAIAGDMNWDGLVNNFDIDAFVFGLSDPVLYTTAYGFSPLYPGDINRDGEFNNFDIDPFIECLANGGCP